MDGQIYGCMGNSVWASSYMDKRMDGWMDGQLMGRYVNIRMDGQMDTCAGR